MLLVFRVVSSPALTVAPLHGGIVCALLASGGIHCWGYTDSGFKLDSTPVASGATLLKVGPQELCAIVAGELDCWEANLDRGFEGMPTVVPGNGSAVALSLGANFKCGMAATGKVGCWSGDTLPALPAAKAVAVGDDFGCVLNTDGQVQCWGAVDRSGVPIIKTNEDVGSPAVIIPYSLPETGDQSPVLLGSPPLGACDNAQDAASMAGSIYQGGILSLTGTCSASCAQSLDPGGCIAPCYAKADASDPVSVACMACFGSYFACPDGDCWKALNACVGFPVYFAVRADDKGTDEPAACPSCSKESPVNEECKSNNDCRSGACDYVPSPQASSVMVCDIK